jgi:nitrate reductase gamma subunit
MTIFLVFPFTRLVHVWSAPIWYLGRRGYQVVRASGTHPASVRHRQGHIEVTQARRPAPRLGPAPAE